MKNKLVLSIIGGIVGIVAIAGVCIGGTYNSLLTAEENVNGQFANVDTVLQRRYDLIPNLVNTVKGYMNHEEEIFTEIANARAKLSGATSIDDKVEASNEMEGALSRLLVVVENYPTLKANENVTALMDELAGTENRISVERSRYNELVKKYNTKIRKFPKNIIANMFDFEQKSYFEATEEASNAPVVNFD